jgi:hypothetical protein
MGIYKDEFMAANRRGANGGRATPLATDARYDRTTDRVVIGLSSGIEVAFHPRQAQGIEHAKPHQLAKIEITPSGLGIHFPRLDADIYLPALLEGFLGYEPGGRGFESCRARQTINDLANCKRLAFSFSAVLLNGPHNDLWCANIRSI